MKAILLLSLLISKVVWSSTGLNLVTPQASKLKNDQPVQTQVKLNGHFLKVSFDVSTDQIYAKPVLQPNEYPFQFDVVELFLSVGDVAYPYYEFEVSPYDQAFVVRIDAPKKFVNNAKAEWAHSAWIKPQGWSAEMTIDLLKLGWAGDVSKIKGNLYAITGKSPNRHFWSLYLPKMKKANFHSPQYFQNLIK